MKTKIFTTSIIIVGLILSTLFLPNLKSINAAKPATVDLTVIVVDAILDYPIEDAEVNVYGTNNYNGFTDRNGEAFFPEIANDYYCIDASYRNKYEHDSVYLADTNITITLYISTSGSLCP